MSVVYSILNFVNRKKKLFMVLCILVNIYTIILPFGSAGLCIAGYSNARGPYMYFPSKGRVVLNTYILRRYILYK